MLSTTVKTCPFCGSVLAPITRQILGRTITIGYQDCTCENAKHERHKRKLEEHQRKAESRARKAEQLLKQSGIPPMFYGAKHQLASELASKVYKGHGLYIHGSVGTYKTTLAVAIGKALIASGERVHFAVASELAQAMRSLEKEDEARYEVTASVPVLILDDLDKVNGTPYACERFWDLVNCRYNLLLPTIITANVPLSEIASKFGGEPTGEAIASRIYQMTDDVQLDGNDARLAS